MRCKVHVRFGKKWARKGLLTSWRGNAYNERGEKQLSDYLDYFHLKKGYMLSYNFNQKKKIGVKEILVGDRVLVEAVV